jgi:hypothetical protein
MLDEFSIDVRAQAARVPAAMQCLRLHVADLACPREAADPLRAEMLEVPVRTSFRSGELHFGTAR